MTQKRTIKGFKWFIGALAFLFGALFMFIPINNVIVHAEPNGYEVHCNYYDGEADCYYDEWYCVDDDTYNYDEQHCYWHCGEHDCYMTFDHDWKDLGKCSICNYSCEHNWTSKTGVCPTCNYSCDHGGITAGECSTCGKILVPTGMELTYNGTNWTFNGNTLSLHSMIPSGAVYVQNNGSKLWKDLEANHAQNNGLVLTSECEVTHIYENDLVICSNHSGRADLRCPTCMYSGIITNTTWNNVKSQIIGTYTNGEKSITVSEDAIVFSNGSKETTYVLHGFSLTSNSINILGHPSTNALNDEAFEFTLENETVTNLSYNRANYTTGPTVESFNLAVPSGVTLSNTEKKKTVTELTTTYLTEKKYTISKGWYSVSEDISLNNITVTISGDVNIILVDGKTFNVTGNYGKAGINISDSSSLTIWGQSSGSGKFISTGKTGGDGISVGAGALTINGGTVNAAGSEGGAGICVASGSLTINGGAVEATGHWGGAGIGSHESSEESVNNITINGGIVNTSGNYGPGIGAGAYSEGNINSITINGGTIIASCADDANCAGIGLGEDATGTINGITIKSTLSVKAGSDATCLSNDFVDLSSGTGFLSGKRYVKIANTYSITNNTSESNKESNNGYITVADKEFSGSEITITIIPNTGYSVDAITVKNADNNAIAVTDNKFTMPESNVTVTVTFIATPEIIFHNDGANWTNGFTPTLEYTEGTSLELPNSNNIKKFGYIFGGWYDNKNYTGDAVTSILNTDTGDKEYWAKWTKVITAEPTKANYYTVSADKSAYTGSYQWVKAVESYLDTSKINYTIESEYNTTTRTMNAKYDSSLYYISFNYPANYLKAKLTIDSDKLRFLTDSGMMSLGEGYYIFTLDGNSISMASDINFTLQDIVFYTTTSLGSEDQNAKFNQNGKTTLEDAYYFCEFKMASKAIAISSFLKPVEIAFDSNGGSGSMASMYQLDGREIKTPSNSFTHDTKVFMYWSDGTSNLGEKVFYCLGSNDVTLKAIWGVTITYDTNGGSSCGSLSAPCVTFPNDNPSKTNCVFDGWYLDKNLKTKAVENADVTVNFTLYAKWIEIIKEQPTKDNDYTVVLDDSFNSGITYKWYKEGYSEFDYTKTVGLSGNEKTTKIITSHEDAYMIDFHGITYGIGEETVGFYYNSGNRSYIKCKLSGLSISDIVCDGGCSIYKDLGDSYFIIETSSYGCIYIGSNKSFTMEDLSVYSQEEISSETSSKLGAITPDGQAIVCGVYKDGVLIATSDVVTAKEISYASGDGATGTNPTTIYQLEGRTITLPSNPYTKTYCVFVGWSDGVNTYNENATYTVGSSNVELAATWTHKHTDGITFDMQISTVDDLKKLLANGGSGYLTNNIVYDGTTTLESQNDLRICLNGYSITTSSKIMIVSNSTLSIYAKEGGKIYATDSLLFYVDDGTSLNIYGGEYSLNGTGNCLFAQVFDDTQTSLVDVVISNFSGIQGESNCLLTLNNSKVNDIYLIDDDSKIKIGGSTQIENLHTRTGNAKDNQISILSSGLTTGASINIGQIGGKIVEAPSSNYINYFYSETARVIKYKNGYIYCDAIEITTEPSEGNDYTVTPDYLDVNYEWYKVNKTIINFTTDNVDKSNPNNYYSNLTNSSVDSSDYYLIMFFVKNDKVKQGTILKFKCSANISDPTGGLLGTLLGPDSKGYYLAQLGEYEGMLGIYLCSSDSYNYTISEIQFIDRSVTSLEGDAFNSNKLDVNSLTESGYYTCKVTSKTNSKAYTYSEDVYVPPYTITYNTDGGSNVDSDTGLKLPDSLPIPTKANYAFAGWYTNEALTNAAVCGNPLTGNITLYAKWVSQHNHDDASYYITLDNISQFGSELPTGNYYLTADITLTEDLIISGNVNICLNDHIINLNGFSIENLGTLTLTDCGNTIRYFDSSSTVWTLTNDVTENYVNGGVITGGSSSYAVINTNGHINLKNINIVGNNSGGFKNNSKANVYDCNILGNNGNLGGGISNSAKLNIYSSNISYNTGKWGGGVYATGVTYIKDSNISYNNAIKGAGIYEEFTVVTLKNTTITNNTATDSGGGVLATLIGCFTEGTKITMADGTFKNIEDINEGDLVKTFNHETGEYENQKVYLAFESNVKSESIKLSFTNDISLNIVGCHDLFNQEANKYVTIASLNADSYVGEHFYNATTNTYEELLSVDSVTTKAYYYSIYTEKNFNCIANNMLSIPDDIDFEYQIFDFNADLTVDQTKLATDIATYGLLAFEDCNVATVEEYESYKVKYIPIIIGKGILTYQELIDRLNAVNYDSYLMYEDYSVGSLIIDSGTIIKDNKLNEVTNNVHIKVAYGNVNVIVVKGASNFDVSITFGSSDNTGVFANDTDSKDYLAYFKSDLDGYSIKATYDETNDIYSYSIVNHTHANAEKTNADAATCTTTGTKEYYKCSCGEYFEDEACSKIIADLSSWKENDGKTNALGHDYSSEWTIDTAATCTTAGSKSHHCTRCSEKSDVTEISALGHSYNDGVVSSQPTCTTKGVKTYTCANDSTHTYTEDVNVLGHSYNEGVVSTQPTCTTKGVKTYTCANDSTHTYTEDVEALGHSYSTEWTIDVAATCTTAGSKSHHCANCSEKTDVTVINALGHNYTSVVTTQPTCTTKGVKTFTCTTCQTTYTEDVEALGHDLVDIAKKDATCTEKGYESGHNCSRCDYTDGQAVINALGHNYEGVITTNPTCTTKGVKTYTCKNDSTHTYTEDVNALGHSWSEYVDDNNATLEKDATKTRTCSTCNEKESVTIPGTKKVQVIETPTSSTEEKTTVSVETEDGFDPNIVIEVKVEVVAGTTVEGSTLEIDYSEQLEKNETLSGVYDVKLLLNGNEIAVAALGAGTIITVKMLVPEELIGKTFRIIHVHNASDVSEIVMGNEASVGTYIIDENGYLVTKIDRLSEFAFIKANDTLSAGAIVGIIFGSLFLLLLIVYILGYFFCYRRGHLDDSPIKVIYIFLPRGDANKEKKEVAKEETIKQ